MNPHDWIAAAALIASIIGASWYVADRLGKLTVCVEQLKRQATTLFDLWNQRDCERHTMRLEEHERRILKLEEG
jgi:hypothetical protein